MSDLVAVFVILLCSKYVENNSVPGEIIKNYHSRNKNIPWIGLLRVSTGNRELVTGLVLIGNHVAIANANDISRIHEKLLSESVKVTFFGNNIRSWDCNVSNYLLHPEFERFTINTIAIVHLDCGLKSVPIHWPKIKNILENMSLVGFTDRNKRLEQVKHQMEPVNSSACKEFYRSEELDFKHIWPRNFLCAKAILMRNECTFDSGMALVANYKGISVLAKDQEKRDVTEKFKQGWGTTGYILLKIWSSPTGEVPRPYRRSQPNNDAFEQCCVPVIGLSTHGPGCSLPSRYIEFYPYIPWIKSHIKVPKGARRSDSETIVKLIDPSSDIVSDSFLNEDDIYITKLNDSTMVLIKALDGIREEAHGDCLNNEGIRMYRDAGLIRAKGRWIGVYALSLYDLYYNEITCVMVSVRCKRRSFTKFWYEKGFNREFFSDLINVVPFPKRGQPVPPKILFLKHFYYDYDNITTANILFKFEFEDEAQLNIDFYGTLNVHEEQSNFTDLEADYNW